MIEKTQRNKAVFLFYLTFILILVFTGYIYFIEETVDPNCKDLNLIDRGIETPLKFWLNGYLGHFFRLKFLGNINWIAFPFFIYFLMNIKSKKRWEIAFFVLYWMAFLLIAVKGYFNTRYISTLFPITISFILVSVWDILLSKKYNFLLKHFIVFILVMTFSNNLFILMLNKGKKTTQIRENSRGRIYSEILRIKQSVNFILNSLENAPDAYAKKFSTYRKKIISDIYVSKNSRKAPYPVVDFLNNFDFNKGKILINNIPIAFYYSNVKSVYYWCGDDIYYTKHGKSRLVENNKNEFLAKFLIDSLKCKYVLSTIQYNLYNDDFNSFINNYCKPIFLDNSDFVVYEISETKVYYPIKQLKDTLNNRLKSSSRLYPEFIIPKYAGG